MAFEKLVMYEMTGSNILKQNIKILNPKIKSKSLLHFLHE